MMGLGTILILVTVVILIGIAAHYSSGKEDRENKEQ